MVQCFINTEYVSSFSKENTPKLLHVCKSDKKHAQFPRVMHKHEDMLEIVFIREGAGTHTIGNKTYSTKQGDILIYNSGVLHDERTHLESSISTYCCGISKLKMEGLAENCLFPDDVEPVIYSGDYFEKISTLFDMMYSEAQFKQSGYSETCNFLLMSILSIILRVASTSANKSDKEEYQLGERIKNFIDEHFMENLSIKALSTALGISQFYLIHTFKQKTGYSPMQYIINRKIGEAQSLLINTNYTISNIASMIGYENPNYFNMLFTKTVGMTPGKYRKSMLYSEL